MIRTVIVAFIITGSIIPLIIGRPIVALWLYLWIANFRPQDWAYTDIITPLRLSIVAGVVFAIKVSTSKYTKLSVTPIVVGLAMILAGAAIGGFSQYQHSASMEGLFQFFVVAGMAILATSVIRTECDLLKTTLLIVVCLSFHTATAGLFAAMSGSEVIAEGVGGFIRDGNSIALASAMLVPISFGCARAVSSVNQYRHLSLALYFIAACNILAVIFTKSRGGFLALATGVLAYAFLNRRALNHKFFLVTLIFIALLAPFIYSALPDGYSDRIASTFEFDESGASEDQSVNSRFHFWKTAVAIFSVNAFGIGINNFGIAYDEFDSTSGFFGRNRAVHNSHLQILVETGLFGILGWVTAFLFTLKKAWNCCSIYTGLTACSPKRTLEISLALMSAIFGFLVGSTFGNYAYWEPAWMFLMLLSCSTSILASDANANFK